MTSAVETLSEALTEIGKDIGNLSKVGKAVEAQANVLVENNQLLKQLAGRSHSQSGNSSTLPTDEQVMAYFSNAEKQLERRRENLKNITHIEVQEGAFDWRLFDGVRKLAFIKQNTETTSNPMQAASRELYNMNGKRIKIMAIKPNGIEQVWEGTHDYRIDIKKRLPEHLKASDLMVMVLDERPVSSSGYRG
ncbi:hypothetical protein [Ursidibacter sp. B-7004-1]